MCIMQPFTLSLEVLLAKERDRASEEEGETETEQGTKEKSKFSN